MPAEFKYRWKDLDDRIGENAPLTSERLLLAICDYEHPDIQGEMEKRLQLARELYQIPDRVPEADNSRQGEAPVIKPNPATQFKEKPNREYLEGSSARNPLNRRGSNMVDDRDSENYETTPLVSSGDGKAYSDSRMDPVSGRPYSSEHSYQQGDEHMPLLNQEE